MDRGMTIEEKIDYRNKKKNRKLGRVILFGACFFILLLGMSIYVLCAIQKQDANTILKDNIAQLETLAGIYFALSISGFVTLGCSSTVIKKVEPFKLVKLTGILVVICSAIVFILQMFFSNLFPARIVNYLALGILSGLISTMFYGVSAALDNEDNRIKKGHRKERSKRR